MKPFPNTLSLKIIIKDKELFIKKLSQLTEERTGKEIDSAIFIGDITKDNFVVKKKMNHHNYFRPIIKGEFSNNTLHLSLELNNNAIYSLLIGYLMIGICIFISEDFIFLVGAFIWTVMCYFMGWAFYSLDFNKTKEGYEIINNLASQQKL